MCTLSSTHHKEKIDKVDQFPNLGIIWLLFVSSCIHLWNHPLMLNFVFVCLYILYLNSRGTHVWSAHRGKKRPSDLWGLELREIESVQEVFWSKPVDTVRKASVLIYWAISWACVESTYCKQNNFIFCMAEKTSRSTNIPLSSPMAMLLDTMLGSLIFLKRCYSQPWWASTSLIYWVLSLERHIWTMRWARFWLLEVPPHWHPIRLETFPSSPAFHSIPFCELSQGWLSFLF